LYIAASISDRCPVLVLRGTSVGYANPNRREAREARDTIEDAAKFWSDNETTALMKSAESAG